MAKTFFSQVTQRFSQLGSLLTNDVRSKVSIGAILIAGLTDLFRDIQNNRNRQTVIFARESHQRSSRFTLDVCGIDYNQPASFQPFGGNGVQQVKRIRRCRLIVLVITHQTSKEVRGKDLC